MQLPRHLKGSTRHLFNKLSRVNKSSAKSPFSLNSYYISYFGHNRYEVQMATKGDSYMSAQKNPFQILQETSLVIYNSKLFVRLPKY